MDISPCPNSLTLFYEVYGWGRERNMQREVGMVVLLLLHPEVLI